eukprot:jgi/Chlat1/5955/Chrsp4S06291
MPRPPDKISAVARGAVAALAASAPASACSGHSRQLLLRSERDPPDELERAWSVLATSLEENIGKLQHAEAVAHILESIGEGPQKLADVTAGLAFLVLTDSKSAARWFDLLIASGREGQAGGVRALQRIAIEKYLRLPEGVRAQLLWVLAKLAQQNAPETDVLLQIIMRQVVELLRSEQPWWFEKPAFVSMVLYTLLRLLPDHARAPALAEFRAHEAALCVQILRERFADCMSIGRDLVRALQEVARMPEFEPIWRDLHANAAAFKHPAFSDLSQIYTWRTPSRFLQSRLTPDMEAQFRFILTQVKMGRQMRHQQAFGQRFLSTAESDALVPDLIRYTCGVYHPTNQLLQSDIVPRWAIIGWLLKCTRTPQAEAAAHLALFWDWLFFDPKSDNIMNIEPGILLMVHSIPKYIDITNALLKFLLTAMETYDPAHKEVTQRGVASAVETLVTRGVVRSLALLTECHLLDAKVREKLKTLFPQYCKPHAELHAGLKMAKDADAGKDSKVKIEGKPKAEAPAQEPVGPSLDEAIAKLAAVVATGSSPEAVDALSQLISIHAKVDDPSVTDRLANDILSMTSSGNQRLFPEMDCLPDVHTVQSLTDCIVKQYFASTHSALLQMLTAFHHLRAPVGVSLLCYAAAEAISEVPPEHVESPKQDSQQFRAWAKTLLPVTSAAAALRKAGIDSNGNVGTHAAPASGGSQSFHAYRAFCAATHASKESTEPGVHIVNDLRSCLSWSPYLLLAVLPAVFRFLPDLAVGSVDVVYLLVSTLDPVELLRYLCSLSLGEYAIFGTSSENVSKLVASSVNWESWEQSVFWKLFACELQQRPQDAAQPLIVAALSATSFQHADALAGLLALLAAWPPLDDVVEAVQALPPEFADFSAAVLAQWASLHLPRLCEVLHAWHHGKTLPSGSRPIRKLLQSLSATPVAHGEKGQTQRYERQARLQALQSALSSDNASGAVNMETG